MIVDLELYFLQRAGAGPGCWEWRGSRSSNGYGTVSPRHPNRWSAHRLGYRLYVGPIPAGLQVLHECDNPPCVRPDHLFLGTQADNIADKVAKGRQARRSRNGMAKLTEAQYDEILDRAAAGEPQRAIARDLDISPSAICQFLRRNSRSVVAHNT